MRTNRLLIATAAVAAAIGPSASGAQEISSPYQFIEREQDLGLYVGYVKTDRGRVNLGPKSAPFYGIQWAMTLNGPMQLSAYGVYLASAIDVIDPAAEGGPAVIGEADLDLFLLGGRLQMNLTGQRTWHNLVPYVFGGIGIILDMTSSPSCLINRQLPVCDLRIDQRFEFGNKFMGQVGLGAIWIMSERIGTRITVADWIWRYGPPVGWLDPDLDLVVVPSDGKWTNNIQVSVRLSFWF